MVKQVQPLKRFQESAPIKPLLKLLNCLGQAECRVPTWLVSLDWRCRYVNCSKLFFWMQRKTISGRNVEWNLFLGLIIVDVSVQQWGTGQTRLRENCRGTRIQSMPCPVSFTNVQNPNCFLLRLWLQKCVIYWCNVAIWALSASPKFKESLAAANSHHNTKKCFPSTDRSDFSSGMFSWRIL